jgi:hypothetical protein
MVLIKKGKVVMVKRPESNKWTLIDKYNGLRKEMMAAGMHRVPPKIERGRKKWLSGQYGILTRLALAA